MWCLIIIYSYSNSDQWSLCKCICGGGCIEWLLGSKCHRKGDYCKGHRVKVTLAYLPTRVDNNYWYPMVKMSLLLLMRHLFRGYKPTRVGGSCHSSGGIDMLGGSSTLHSSPSACCKHVQVWLWPHTIPFYHHEINMVYVLSACNRYLAVVATTVIVSDWQSGSVRDWYSWTYVAKIMCTVFLFGCCCCCFGGSMEAWHFILAV